MKNETKNKNKLKETETGEARFQNVCQGDD